MLQRNLRETGWRDLTEAFKIQEGCFVDLENSFFLSGRATFHLSFFFLFPPEIYSLGNILQYWKML
jgi:hypothetical protein